MTSFGSSGSSDNLTIAVEGLGMTNSSTSGSAAGSSSVATELARETIGMGGIDSLIENDMIAENPEEPLPPISSAKHVLFAVDCRRSMHCHQLLGKSLFKQALQHVLAHMTTEACMKPDHKCSVVFFGTGFSHGAISDQDGYIVMGEMTELKKSRIVQLLKLAQQEIPLSSDHHRANPPINLESFDKEPIKFSAGKDEPVNFFTILRGCERVISRDADVSKNSFRQLRIITNDGALKIPSISEDKKPKLKQQTRRMFQSRIHIDIIPIAKEGDEFFMESLLCVGRLNGFAGCSPSEISNSWADYFTTRHFNPILSEKSSGAMVVRFGGGQMAGSSETADPSDAQMCLGFKQLTMVQPISKPKVRKMHSRTGSQILTNSTWLCEDTMNTLGPGRIQQSLEVGDQKFHVPFTSEIWNQMTQGSALGVPKGIDVLGAVPKEVFDPKYCFKPGRHLIPDDSIVPGTSACLDMLVDCLHEQALALWGIALERSNASARLVLLVPQKKQEDDNGRIIPLSFFMSYLPWQDNVRHPPAPEGYPAVDMSDKERSLWKNVIKMFKISWSPDRIDNKDVIGHYENIISTALHDTSMPHSVEEAAWPIEDSIHGSLDARQELAEFCKLKYGDDVEMEAVGSKRSRQDNGSDWDESAFLSIMHDSVAVNKLTVATLKAGLKFKGKDSSGMRKPALVQALLKAYT